MRNSLVIGANGIIGRETIVGAGSVVAKRLPPNSVAFGVPAKMVRSRLMNAATVGGHH
jgi:acetyltransferase-like isoleucine patch superfamily enzyme